MNARARVLLVVLFVFGAVILLVMYRTPPPPAAVRPSLRLVQGELRRFDAASLRYEPITVGEVEFGESLMSGDSDTVLRLATGGTVALAPLTAFTASSVSSSSAVRLRVEEGRVWLHLKVDEPAEVGSFHSLVQVEGGDCEVRVYKDKDAFINTEVRMWNGRGRLKGGARLNVERPLAPGLTTRVDDATVYPVTRFDTVHPDPWQKRMLELP